MDEARHFQYPDEQKDAGFLARELGAGGISFTHTCPDLSIGLQLGWTGFLEKVRKYKKQYEESGEQDKVDYLTGSELIAESIIRYIKRHADKARELAKTESNNEQLNIYLAIAETCDALATRAPQSLREAVQWIWMFQVVERMHGHGNGYGRTDQLLIDFYRSDMEKGTLTRQEARELVGEMYIKYGS